VCFNLRKSGGAILASVGNHCTWADLTVPVTIRMVWLSSVSILWQCVLLVQPGAQYSATLYTSAIADIRNILALLPQFELASLEIMLFLDYRLPIPQ